MTSLGMLGVYATVCGAHRKEWKRVEMSEWDLHYYRPRPDEDGKYYTMKEVLEPYTYYRIKISDELKPFATQQELDRQYATEADMESMWAEWRTRASDPRHKRFFEMGACGDGYARSMYLLLREGLFPDLDLVERAFTYMQILMLSGLFKFYPKNMCGDDCRGIEDMYFYAECVCALAGDHLCARFMNNTRNIRCQAGTLLEAFSKVIGSNYITELIPYTPLGRFVDNKTKEFGDQPSATRSGFHDRISNLMMDEDLSYWAAVVTMAERLCKLAYKRDTGKACKTNDQLEVGARDVCSGPDSGPPPGYEAVDEVLTQHVRVCALARAGSPRVPRRTRHAALRLIRASPRRAAPRCGAQSSSSDRDRNGRRRPSPPPSTASAIRSKPSSYICGQPRAARSHIYICARRRFASRARVGRERGAPPSPPSRGPCAPARTRA